MQKSDQDGQDILQVVITQVQVAVEADGEERTEDIQKEGACS